MHRLIFCGDRNWLDDSWIRMVMTALAKNIRFEVIEGEAKGADTLARDVAIELGIKVKKFPADWSVGRAAGPIRNKQMLDEGRATGVVAFHLDIAASKGTANMIAQARKARIPVWICTEGPDALKTFISLLQVIK